MRANDSNSSGIGTILLGMAAIALAGMVGTIGLIQQVGELGPKVGDIIAFDPTATLSGDMKARVTATHTVDSHGASCILDVRTMHRSGGSLIVEARQRQDSHGLRVHWAGARSSDDGSNCGSSADLLLGLDDIEVLAMAAGGYGVPASKLTHISLASLTAATQ